MVNNSSQSWSDQVSSKTTTHLLQWLFTTIHVVGSEDTEVDSDKEQHDEHKVAFFSSELNLYLKAKNCSYYQVPLYNKHSALTLEQSLLEFTGLDVLDEDNKFICQHCTNGK